MPTTTGRYQESVGVILGYMRFISYWVAELLLEISVLEKTTQDTCVTFGSVLGLVRRRTWLTLVIAEEYESTQASGIHRGSQWRTSSVTRPHTVFFVL